MLGAPVIKSETSFAFSNYSYNNYQEILQ
jgi:hypothetical protein